MTIRLLIADDQPLMRAALRMSLAAEPGFEVIGEAVDGRQAVEMATRLFPDVVVMDIRMPTLDGIAATRRVTIPREGRSTKVLVLTTFDLDEYLLDALQAGASGFLLKDATAEELVHAVRVIAEGHALLAPNVTKRLLELYRRPPDQPGGDPRILASLTPREIAVLKLVAQGLSNAEIASTLTLAESSVKTHVGHLLAKLHLPHRTQLVVLAYESGIVRPRPPEESPLIRDRRPFPMRPS